MANFKTTTVHGNLVVTGNAEIIKPTFENATWDEITEYVKEGRGEELFPIGSEKHGIMNGSPVTFIVLDHDHEDFQTVHIPQEILDSLNPDSFERHSMTIWLKPDEPIKSIWTNDASRVYYDSDNCIAKTTILSWLNYFDGNNNMPKRNDHLVICKKIIYNGSESIIPASIFLPSYAETGIAHYQQVGTDALYEGDFRWSWDGTTTSYRPPKEIGYKYFVRDPSFYDPFFTEDNPIASAMWTRTNAYSNQKAVISIRNIGLQRQLDGTISECYLFPCFAVGGYTGF